MAVATYFSVWPEEANVLKAADLSGLAAIVERLNLQVDDKRPIKLFLPKVLLKAIEKQAGLKHKKKDILLAAAREFRRRFPQVESRMKLPPTMDNYDKGERSSWVLRLDSADRQLLEDIGKGNPKIGNRYDAFIEMAAMIPKMKFADLTDRKRISLYLPIPDDLEIALQAKQNESKMPRVRILLQAIEEQPKVRR
jgi:hypothetical protein